MKDLTKTVSKKSQMLQVPDVNYLPEPSQSKLIMQVL